MADEKAPQEKTVAEVKTDAKPVKKATRKASKKVVYADPSLYSVIKYPISTEKAIRLMESDNKLVFVVDMGAKKYEIKEAVEKLFKVKVLAVNTLIDRKAKKRAYVKLSPDNLAMDIATNLGMM